MDCRLRCKDVRPSPLKEVIGMVPLFCNEKVAGRIDGGRTEMDWGIWSSFSPSSANTLFGCFFSNIGTAFFFSRIGS